MMLLHSVMLWAWRGNPGGQPVYKIEALWHAQFVHRWRAGFTGFYGQDFAAAGR